MRIPGRHREGRTDWLDCRDLLRETLDPNGYLDLGDVRNVGSACKGSLAVAQTEIGTNADPRGNPSSDATGSRQAPRKACG